MRNSAWRSSALRLQKPSSTGCASNGRWTRLSAASCRANALSDDRPVRDGGGFGPGSAVAQNVARKMLGLTYAQAQQLVHDSCRRVRWIGRS